MPIPSLNSDGLLPPGVFECALPEIKARFGAFNISDRRPELYRRLEEFVAAAKGTSLFCELLIDGSFVTGKPLPNDIDILAALRHGHDFERDPPVSEYALVSRTLLRRRFGFDVVVAEYGSPLYRTYVDFFSRVRELPEVRKGLLRLSL